MAAAKQEISDLDKSSGTISVVQELDSEQNRLGSNPISTVEDTWKPAKWRRMLAVVWDTFELPPGERQYVQRLDFFIFSYSLLSYVVKYLDQGNVSNAYVSGMQEDARNENLFTTFFNIGYLIGSFPTQVIMTRIRPSYFIPSCEVLWGILVMTLAAANNAKTIYGIRFVVGLCEATVFPGFMWILGSWYYPSQLAKRMALFECSSSAAGMFSGYIQTGAYAHMNGLYGIAGWRWAFILDGIISIPIACMGYYCLPDFPTTTQARWLNKEQRAYGVARMAKLGRKPPKKFTLQRLGGFFFSLRPWVFCIPYNIGNFGSSYSYFNLWLKATGRYSVEQINILPTAGNAISIVVTYSFSLLSDITRRRATFAFAATVIPFFTNICLAVWNISFNFKLAVNLINYAGWSYQPVLNAWASEAFQDDAEMRGLMIGMGNTINYAMNAWLPLVLFPTTEAPVYKYGYKFSAGFYGIELVSIPMFYLFVKWDHKRRGKVINKYGLAIDRDDLDYSESDTVKEIVDIEKGSHHVVTVHEI
ncbi:major facilitator superfamily domain-containing protein [Lipomyces oligophaga]|uniref:major facilitator superfamily domain-containing protein n=1 Tax=Lipomyces oligophaga TaxID=45792 RepID=UPI0034CF16E8